MMSEVIRLKGRGDVNVPLKSLSSLKIYRVEVETEQSENPSDIFFTYEDCRGAGVGYGGSIDSHHFHVETSICPDMTTEPPHTRGKLYYNGEVQVKPIKGEWTLTLLEDLNNRGTPDTTTSAIFIEHPARIP